MSNDKTYNGWSNYETWNVALWLSNEQYSERACREMVERAGSVSKGADAIQEYVEQLNPLIDDCSMYSDILSAALHEVDWYEVAESFKPDEWGEGDEPPEEEDEPDPDEPEGTNPYGDDDDEDDHKFRPLSLAYMFTKPEDLDFKGHGYGDEFALRGVCCPGVERIPLLLNLVWLRDSDIDYDWQNDHNVYPRE